MHKLMQVFYELLSFTPMEINISFGVLHMLFYYFTTLTDNL